MSTLLSALPRRGKLSLFGLPVLFFALFFLMGSYQGISQPASTADETQIIQNCIDLPGMQQFYPKNENGEAQVHIYYYHPLLFSTELQVAKDNRQVPLKEISAAIKEITNPFFLFTSFSISNNTANVGFEFYYLQGDTQHKVEVKLDLEKSGNIWTVIKTDIKN